VGRFSIRDIENITGIKAHTIRIWEQRYNLVVSRRTDTNIRFYDDKDLCTFLNIANLTENGYRISEVAKMSPEEMVSKISSLSADHNNPCILVNSLTESMLEFDQERFSQTIFNCTENHGLINTMEETLFPFLRKVGFMWQADLISPAHEHFVTNLIKARIINAIESLPEPPMEKAKRFLLFLPINEFHEIGLCYAHYLIKQSGNKVLFLGQSVPYPDLRITSEKFDPHFCLTTLTSLQTDGNLVNTIDDLLKHLPFWPLIISGPQVAHAEVPFRERLSIFRSLGDLKEFLTNLDQVPQMTLA